ncbi:MAG: LamG domain-containing protein [Myxococcota bacterium]|nr:LamG domain-containing protein [Myxococcota bacterium]
MRPVTLLLIPLLAACKGDDSGIVPEGPHAISFDGGPSCASARAQSAGPPPEFTFEAWVKADPGSDQRGHPFVVWDGVAALWQSADGYVVMSDASGELVGAAYPADVMDQEAHHVAGTWDGAVMSVYVDGVRGAFSSAGRPGDSGEAAVYVGCWPARQQNHQGLMDEIRVSSSVRYTDDYEVPSEEFVEDPDTLHLWHVDEGYGDRSADAAGGPPLRLIEVSWVSGALADQHGG